MHRIGHYGCNAIHAYVEVCATGFNGNSEYTVLYMYRIAVKGGVLRSSDLVQTNLNGRTMHFLPQQELEFESFAFQAKP